MRSGDAFNVVPGNGELIADVRADRLDAFDGVLRRGPGRGRRRALTARLVREWPGMDARAATAPLLQRGGRRARAARSSARTAAAPATPSHFAATIPLTVDGLGPRGGGAHKPGEFVLASSLRTRAEVALAVARCRADERDRRKFEAPTPNTFKDRRHPPTFRYASAVVLTSRISAVPSPGSGGTTGRANGGMGRIIAIRRSSAAFLARARQLTP